MFYVMWKNVFLFYFYYCTTVFNIRVSFNHKRLLKLKIELNINYIILHIETWTITHVSNQFVKSELPPGLEPGAYGLHAHRSNRWAMEAQD